MKKTVLLFVFDGFADWQTSYATAGIKESDVYQVKTIALEKEPVTTLSGMCVLPDLDFRPEVDLADLDNTNTAMIILPGGDLSVYENKAVQLLVKHCLIHFVHVASMVTTNDITPIEFANAIFDVLNIERNEIVYNETPYFESMVSAQ